MIFRNSLIYLVFSLLILPTIAFSQVVSTGKIQEASSQLIYWYDTDDGRDAETDIQLTNTSDTTAVEVHIQIYSTDDTTRCLEADFNDVYTPNDTHVYDLDGTIWLNQGENSTGAPIDDVDDTKGFIVITPVVGNGDNTAISFQHLIGTSAVDLDAPEVLYRVNAMGRDAVDLTTGQILDDGISLDGISTGFVMFQPSEVSFNVFSETNSDNVDVVAIVFSDQFGPPGLLGYRAIPGESTMSPFLFNFAETPGSCPVATNECFNNWGLSSDLEALNQLTDPLTNICNAIELSSDPQGFFTGWTRFFIGGLDSNENQLVLSNYTGTGDDDDDDGGADWAHTK